MAAILPRPQWVKIEIGQAAELHPRKRQGLVYMYGQYHDCRYPGHARIQVNTILGIEFVVAKYST